MTILAEASSGRSDLASASTARTNLGLTALATTSPGSGVTTALGDQVNQLGGCAVNGGVTTYNPSGSSPTVTVDCSLGTYYVINLARATGTPVIAFSNAFAGCSILLEMQQASTAVNCTFPTNTIQSGGGSTTYMASGNSNTDLIAVAFKDSTHPRICVTSNYH